MIGELAAAVSSCKTVYDLVKAARELTNYNEVVAAVSEVQGKLLDANTAALQAQAEQYKLQGKVTELEKKLGEVEDWKHRIGRYKLHEFPTGALAFALREDMGEGEPMHYICANCADRGHISRMQPHGSSLICHPCNFSIQYKPSKPLPKTSTGGGGSWMAS